MCYLLFQKQNNKPPIKNNKSDTDEENGETNEISNNNKNKVSKVTSGELEMKKYCLEGYLT